MEDLRELTKALERAPTLGATHEAICDAIPTPIIISNSDGVIILINREAELLTFYKREELMGAKVEVLVPESKRGIHAENHRPEYMRHPYRREMGKDMSLSIRRKDGTEVPVEIQLDHVPGDRYNVTTFREKTDNHPKKDGNVIA